MSTRRLALALTATLALAACSSSKPDATVAPTPTTTASPSTTTTEPTATTLGTQTPTTQAASVAERILVPNMVGEDLQLAQDTMQASGFYILRSHDASGQGRSQVLDRSWKVCDQLPPGGSTVAASQFIDFGVVKDEERCP